MHQHQFGRLWPVSTLTLGGGGLGMLWGETTFDECVATVRAAVEAGINLLDLAPRYGDGKAEEVVGEAFAGKLPDGVRVTSKCNLGEPPPAEIEAMLRRSIEGSLQRLRLSRLDLFFLHSNVVPDSDHRARRPDAAARMTLYATFVAHVRPIFERLVGEGVIGAWGLTGIGHPDTIIRLLGETPAPAAVQCIANLLELAGRAEVFRWPGQAARGDRRGPCQRGRGHGHPGGPGRRFDRRDRPAAAGRPSGDARLCPRRRVSPAGRGIGDEPGVARAPLCIVARDRHPGARRQEPCRTRRMRRRRRSGAAPGRAGGPDRSIGGPFCGRVRLRHRALDILDRRYNGVMRTAQPQYLTHRCNSQGRSRSTRTRVAPARRINPSPKRATASNAGVEGSGTTSDRIAC